MSPSRYLTMHCQYVRSAGLIQCFWRQLLEGSRNIHGTVSSNRYFQAMIAPRIAVMLALTCLASGQQQPDLLLNGVITRADHQTYKEVAFTVPEGVERLTVEF